MSSYLKNILIPGEKVIATGGSHTAVYTPGVVYIMFAICMGFLKIHLEDTYGLSKVVYSLNNTHITIKNIVYILYNLSIIFYIYGLYRLMGAFNEYACAEYVVTNHRLIVKEGIVGRSISEMDLHNVVRVQIEQGVLGKILDYADVTVFDHAGERIYMPTTASPYDFQKQVAIDDHLFVH